jgi:hypothetical protein
MIIVDADTMRNGANAAHFGGSSVCGEGSDNSVPLQYCMAIYRSIEMSLRGYSHG